MPDAIYDFLTAIGYPHPLHPVLTHITVGSVIAAFIFGLIAWIFNRNTLMASARYLIILAFISAFVTAGIGVVDWLHFYGGELLTAILAKMIGTGVLVLLLIATLILQRNLPRESRLPVLFYFLLLINVIVLGYFGGNLVYGSG